jgi:hypothetical protein
MDTNLHPSFLKQHRPSRRGLPAEQPLGPSRGERRGKRLRGVSTSSAPPLAKPSAVSSAARLLTEAATRHCSGVDQHGRFATGTEGTAGFRRNWVHVASGHEVVQPGDAFHDPRRAADRIGASARRLDPRLPQRVPASRLPAGHRAAGRPAVADMQVPRLGLWARWAAPLHSTPDFGVVTAWQAAQVWPAAADQPEVSPLQERSGALFRARAAHEIAQGSIPSHDSL